MQKACEMNIDSNNMFIKHKNYNIYGILSLKCVLTIFILK